MDVLVEYLPFLIPLIIIEWILAITALLFYYKSTLNVRFGCLLH